MKPITVAILAVAAVASTGAAVLAYKTRVGEQLGQVRAEVLFPGLAARLDNVARVEIQGPAEKFTLVKAGQGWAVADKSNFPAKFEPIKKAAVGLGELKSVEAKTRQVDSFARLEVEDPGTGKTPKSARITLKDDKGGVLADLIVGKKRYGSAGATDFIYVRRPGDGQAWLAEPAFEFRPQAVEFLDRDVVDVKEDRIVETVLTLADGARTRVFRAQPGDKDFQLDGVPDDKKIKAPYNVNQIGQVLESLQLDDVRPVAEVKFEGERGGIWRAKDGLVVTIALAEQEGATWAKLTASYEPPAVPVEGAKPADEVKAEAEKINQRTGNWAYKLPGWKLEKLNQKADELVEPKDGKAS